MIRSLSTSDSIITICLTLTVLHHFLSFIIFQLMLENRLFYVYFYCKNRSKFILVSLVFWYIFIALNDVMNGCQTSSFLNRYERAPLWISRIKFFWLLFGFNKRPLLDVNAWFFYKFKFHLLLVWQPYKVVVTRKQIPITILFFMEIALFFHPLCLYIRLSKH